MLPFPLVAFNGLSTVRLFVLLFHCLNLSVLVGSLGNA